MFALDRIMDDDKCITDGKHGKPRYCGAQCRLFYGCHSLGAGNTATVTVLDLSAGTDFTSNTVSN